MAYKFIDLFAGIGGFRLAFEELGFECVFSSEIDRHACKTYFANFGEKPSGDITKIPSEEIPDFDVLCAGFPCQAWSGMGKKLGFLDDRGQLIFEIERILKDKQPKMFLLENVKGLVSHDKRKTFPLILKLLEDCGYKVLWKILDSQDFGVAQHRERVFLVGIRSGLDGEFEFPEPYDYKVKFGEVREQGELDSKYTLLDGTWNHLIRHQAKHNHNFGYKLVTDDMVTPTLTKRYYKDGKEALVPQEGKNPRKLTVLECKRLQGFPDDFIIPVKNRQAYMQFGNTVTVTVVRELAKNILQTLNQGVVKEMQYQFPNEFAELVFNKKYSGENKTIEELISYGVEAIRTELAKEFDRIPEEISLNINNLEDMLLNGRFMFGGRILSAFGNPSRKVSYYNCSTVPIQSDSIEGIMDAMYKVAKISSRGQGVGVSFSALRPRGAHVNSAAYTSTGAVSFMELMDALGNTLVQDGSAENPARRLALLFSLAVDHPDILDFIEVKQKSGKITNANISIEMTEKFLEAVQNDEIWELQFDGVVYNTIPARELMRRIAESNHRAAEPGVLFLENARKSALCETLGFPIVGVNACSEAILDYAGVCNLGSLNLGKYFHPEGGKDIEELGFDESPHFYVDWAKLSRDVYSAVLALDTVISLEFSEGRVPLPEQGRSQEYLRRIGLGIMGLADLLALLGLKYGSEESVKFTDELMRFIVNEAYVASAYLARLLGPAKSIQARPSISGFGTDYRHLLSHPFIKKLNMEYQLDIEAYGLRNAAIMSIAPTGSISNVAGCTSGVEPLFRKSYSRFTRLSGDWEEVVYNHPVSETNPDALWVEADEVKPVDKLKMVAAVQKWVDQSVSNTGVFPDGTTVEEIEDFYREAFYLGVKGLTVYVENDITKETRGAILVETEDTPTEEELVLEPEFSMYMGDACRIDFETGETHCD